MGVQPAGGLRRRARQRAPILQPGVEYPDPGRGQVSPGPQPCRVVRAHDTADPPGRAVDRGGLVHDAGACLHNVAHQVFRAAIIAIALPRQSPSRVRSAPRSRVHITRPRNRTAPQAGFLRGNAQPIHRVLSGTVHTTWRPPQAPLACNQRRTAHVACRSSLL